MHHFATIVCKTLSEDVVIQDLWQHDVPKEGLQHTHLMHALLALSALHLYYSSNDVQEATKYHKQAVQHYESALSRVQQLVVQIDEANCDSVLAAATLLGYFLSFSVRFGEGERIIEDLWFTHQLLRGIRTVDEHAAAYSSRRRLSAIVKTKPWDRVLIPAGFEQGMEVLCLKIRSGDDAVRTEILLSAVQRLQEMVKADIVNPQHITISYMFLLAADRKYMVLVSARDQMAWAILAHYAAILHRQRHQWWMGHNGVQLLSAVKGLFDADFGALVKWLDQFLLERAETRHLDTLLYYS
jgi:Fungal specific transcription factor domain